VRTLHVCLAPRVRTLHVRIAPCIYDPHIWVRAAHTKRYLHHHVVLIVLALEGEDEDEEEDDDPLPQRQPTMLPLSMGYLSCPVHLAASCKIELRTRARPRYLVCCLGCGRLTVDLRHEKPDRLV